MFDDLRSKRVLITGSSAGIGLAAAQAFARQGARVGLNARKKPAGFEAVLADSSRHLLVSNSRRDDGGSLPASHQRCLRIAHLLHVLRSIARIASIDFTIRLDSIPIT